MLQWILTSRQHAAVDHVWALALPVIPRLLGWNRKATTALDAAAALGAVQTVFTDFEGGKKPVIPMQCHLAGDAVIGIGLLALAAGMKNESTAERIGLGVAGLLATASAVMTEPIPRGKGRERAKTTAKSWRKRMGYPVAQFAGANPKKAPQHTDEGREPAPANASA